MSFGLIDSAYADKSQADKLWMNVVETLPPDYIYEITSEMESNVEKIATHINDNSMSISDAKSYMDKLELIQLTAVRLSSFSISHDDDFALNDRHENLAFHNTDKLITELEKIIKQQKNKDVKPTEADNIPTKLKPQSDEPSSTELDILKNKLKNIKDSMSHVGKDIDDLREVIDRFGNDYDNLSDAVKNYDVNLPSQDKDRMVADIDTLHDELTKLYSTLEVLEEKQHKLMKDERDYTAQIIYLKEGRIVNNDAVKALAKKNQPAVNQEDLSKFKKSLVGLDEEQLYFIWDEINENDKSGNKKLKLDMIDAANDKLPKQSKPVFDADIKEKIKTSDEKLEQKRVQAKIQDLKDKISKADNKVKKLFAKDTTSFSNEDREKHEKKYQDANNRLNKLIDKLEKLKDKKNYPNQQPIVQPDVAPEINRQQALANNQALGVEEVQKKSGGGGSDWKKKPTFGKSHNTHSQLIENGFTFNGYVLTITDNWHTDFAKTTSIIGDENHVRIVTYAADTLKSVSLSLGIPEIGKKSDAETSILLNLEHDYNADVLYQIDEIIHEQKEKLINEDKTIVYVNNVKCNENSNSKSCYAFDVYFTVMAPLSHDVVAITAVDNHRRTHTTFINEGVEFVGESLLNPETITLFQKKSNQDKGKYLELIREDRRYNIWIDENGLLWEKNNYNSFKQITFADYTKADDSTKSVMNRLHSAFGGLIQSEAERAISVWNSTSIQSQIGESFTHEIPITYSNKLDDPKVINSLQYQEKVAIQQLRHE